MKNNSNIKLGLIHATDMNLAKFQLVDFIITFDNDLSGENGCKNTLEIALQNDYESTIEYFVYESKKTNVDDLINDVMDKVLNTYSDYDFSDWNYHEAGKEHYVIAFVNTNK